GAREAGAGAGLRRAAQRLRERIMPVRGKTAEVNTRPTWRRRLLRGILTLVVPYLGIIVVLMLLENWLIFRAVSADQHWIEPLGLDVRDVELRTADGIGIHAWWCPREGAEGALLYCHGNAGNLSYRGGAIPPFQHALNVSVLIFDYPGFGKSEGSPDEAGCYAAADAAYDWLTQIQKIPPECLLLYGKSLGGAVAVELASRRPCRAL